MAAGILLASFSSQARGIQFYGAPLSSINVGKTFVCELEPLNPYDPNCIGLYFEPDVKLGHLAREDASPLSSLLREGFQARG
jgi:hypothetical protein